MGKSKAEQENRSGRLRPSRRTAAVADWCLVDAGVIRDSIASAGSAGGALRFGFTRDGGAYALGIYGLGDPYTEYIRPGDDIEGFLRDIAEAFRDTPGGKRVVHDQQLELPALKSP